MDIWEIVGYGLLGWACYDISKGRTYLFKAINRSEQPVLFWVVALVWTAIALYLILKY